MQTSDDDEEEDDLRSSPNSNSNTHNNSVNPPQDEFRSSIPAIVGESIVMVKMFMDTDLFANPLFNPSQG